MGYFLFPGEPQARRAEGCRTAMLLTSLSWFRSKWYFMFSVWCSIRSKQVLATHMLVRDLMLE